MSADCWGPPPTTTYRCPIDRCDFTADDPAALRDHLAREVFDGAQVVERLRAAGIPVVHVDPPVLARQVGNDDATHALAGRTAVDAGAPMCGRGITVTVVRDDRGAPVPAGLYGIGAHRRPTCKRCHAKL